MISIRIYGKLDDINAEHSILPQIHYNSYFTIKPYMMDHITNYNYAWYLSNQLSHDYR